jgi:hypothetical protein
MARSILSLALSVLLTLPLLAQQTTLVKQPKYNGKTGYAMLKFGQKTPQDVWMILDGETLYLDLNGNGDLTEVGEKFTGKILGTKSEPTIHFEIDKLAVGKKLHRGFNLWVTPQKTFEKSPLIEGQSVAQARIKAKPDALTVRISVEVQAEKLQGNGHENRVLQYVLNGDDKGLNTLAEEERQAPVFHFDGPLEFVFQTSITENWTGGQQADAYVAMITAGTSPGTSVQFGFDTLPTSLQPKLSIEYTPTDKTKPGTKDEVKLPERC